MALLAVCRASVLPVHCGLQQPDIGAAGCDRRYANDQHTFGIAKALTLKVPAAAMALGPLVPVRVEHATDAQAFALWM